AISSRYARWSSAAVTSLRSSSSIAPSAVSRSASIPVKLPNPPQGGAGPPCRHGTEEVVPCPSRNRDNSCAPRRDAEEAAVGVGRVRERLRLRERDVRLVLPEDVDQVERVRGRLDTRQVQLAHLADRLEDRAQLLLEPRNLLLGQREPRQP